MFLGLGERIVSQELENRGNPLDWRAVGFAALPMPNRFGSHAEQDCRLPLGHLQREPAPLDVLARGVRLKVGFLRPRPPEPKRDESQKSNATLSVWVSRTSDCRCDDATVARYVAKLSGPLLDRIDLHVEVMRVPFDEIVARTAGEPSATIRTRVERARALQRRRYSVLSRQTNASIGAREARRFCILDADAIALLRDASARGNLSARALDRLARVARTIADLEGVPAIEVRHIAEAIGYRTLERKGLAA